MITIYSDHPKHALILDSTAGAYYEQYDSMPIRLTYPDFCILKFGITAHLVDTRDGKPISLTSSHWAYEFVDETALLMHLLRY